MLTRVTQALRQIFNTQQFLPVLGVFLAYFLAAKLGQYIFFSIDSAPAVIWAPAGIALAAILLGGTRMWLPLAIAHLCALATSATPPALPFALAGMLGTVLQPLVGSYALSRLGFRGTLGSVRDAFLLVGGTIVVSAIFPSVMLGAQILFHAPQTAFMWGDWSRAWAASALSILALTPLITSWYLREERGFTSEPVSEASAAFAVLAGALYLIFWTPLAGPLGLPLVCVLWMTLFWISIRLAPRYMTAAVALTAVIAFAGGIIAHPTDVPLSQQLFGDELIIMIFAPIFLVFAGVVEERRAVTRELAARVRELDRITAKLSADDRAKNEFIATLAHELRNPLSPIVSTLELLGLRASGDAESLEIIEGAQQQSMAMRRLLDDLLDVARISRNKMILIREAVDLRTILERSVRSTESLLRERGHALSFVPPADPVWVDGDPVRLEQIYVNLLNNAAKYTEPGGRIELSCAREQGSAVVRVRDSGIGISASQLQDIFLPFRQKATAPHQGSGLGIGLSLTKQLAEMHGGGIEAHSEGEGRGSTFTVRLPLATVPSNSEHRTSPADRKGYSARCRVLVVDDNQPAAKGIGKLLEHGGHSVSLAHSGEDALRAEEAERPQVVLLDIGLPDIDGYEVARRLRERDRGARLLIVAVTGYGQQEDKRKAAEAGFDAHLTKPAGIADIERVLVRARRGA